MKQAKDKGFSTGEVQLLENYYDSQSNYYERAIADMMDPVGSQVRNLEKGLVRMRANPLSKPEDLRQLEKEIEIMRSTVKKP